jgi:hypothetical protein
VQSYSRLLLLLHGYDKAGRYWLPCHGETCNPGSDGAGCRLMCYWRRGSESNRRPRLCRPLHNHSATPPYSENRNGLALSQGVGLRLTAKPYSEIWSGKGVSNSRPQPWQGHPAAALQRTTPILYMALRGVVLSGQPDDGSEKENGACEWPRFFTRQRRRSQASRSDRYSAIARLRWPGSPCAVYTSWHQLLDTHGKHYRTCGEDMPASQQRAFWRVLGGMFRTA